MADAARTDPARPGHASETAERSAAGLALMLAVIAVWLVWAWYDGGFAVKFWGPLGAALVVLPVVAAPALRVRGRLRIIALAAFASLVAWSFLTMLWAAFPADAWNESAKTLVYVACVVIFVSVRASARDVTIALATFTGAVALVAVAVLVRVAESGDLAHWFADGRLVPPTGYTNASAALWTIAVWPALWLSATRVFHPILHAAFPAAATLFVDVAIIAQSRGWALALVPTAVIFVATARERLRSLVAIAIVGAAATLSARPLIHVYDSAKDGVPTRASLHHALAAIAIACAAAAMAGLVWAALDRRVRQSRRALLLTTGMLIVVIAAAGTVGAIRAHANSGRAHAALQHVWRDFTCRHCEPQVGSARFTGGLADERYGEWSVAWREFRAHPIGGLGADNYAAAYLARRTNALIEPRFPHSLELHFVAELGLVGALLFAIAVVALLAAALRNRRAVDSAEGGAIGACITMFAYWALHGSVDWFWEVPALAAPALAFLALAARDVQAAPAGKPRRDKRITVAAIAVTLCAAGAVLLPWAADRAERSGIVAWSSDHAQAYSRLEDAAKLDPLAGDPLAVEGALSLLAADRANAGHSLDRAVTREPDNWYAWFQLALLHASLGERQRAASDFTTARRLNPKDPIAAFAQRVVARGMPVAPAKFDALYALQIRRRFGLGPPAPPQQKVYLPPPFR